MSFANISVQLAADLATNGTFTSAYPSGSTKGDFFFGQQHRIVNAAGDVFVAPTDFTLALTSAALFTVTWKAASTQKAGTQLVVQLDQVGSNFQSTRVNKDGTAKAIGGFATIGLLGYVSLGTPAAASATALINAQAATGAANTQIAVVANPDVPRNLVYVSSNVGDTTQTVTVTGTDVNGAVTTEKVTLNGTTSVVGAKAFRTVTSYAYSANLAGTLSIGTGVKLGLPVYVQSTVQFLKEIQDGTAAAAGTLAAGDVATPTNLTGDPRGTYSPAVAPDGAKSYALILALLDYGYQGATPA